MPEPRSTRFALRLAASPDAPASARLFVSASLRVIGCDEDTIEDAKLAVSELVTAAVLRDSDQAIEVAIDSETLVVGVARLEAADLDRDAGLVLDSLFDRAKFDSGVGFVVRPTDDA